MQLPSKCVDATSWGVQVNRAAASEPGNENLASRPPVDRFVGRIPVWVLFALIGIVEVKLVQYPVEDWGK